jgi:hypothetical protein
LLKLINAGLGRTGTTSLMAALDQLGFGPSYHMLDLVSTEESLEQWEKILCDGQQPDWEAIYEGYTSAVDGPNAIYYEQIMKAFPEAKVILTLRDAERWYQSTHDTVYQFAVKYQENPAETGSRQSRLYRVTNAMFWDGLFSGRFADKEYAMEVYRNHNQEVIHSVDPGKLLVYDVKQGWEPLCAFLGADVPPEDFPHLNNSESMRKMLGQLASGHGPGSPGWAH